jgi:hypothetical protein
MHRYVDDRLALILQRQADALREIDDVRRLARPDRSVRGSIGRSVVRLGRHVVGEPTPPWTIPSDRTLARGSTTR